MTRFLAIALISGLTIGCGGGSTSTDTPPATPAPPAGSGASDGSETKKEEGSGTTEVKFNLKGLPTLAVSVPGIHCEACAEGVNETLIDVAGVKEVTVDVDTKVATVAIDKEMFDADTAIKALADAEFPGSTVVEKDAEVAKPGA